MSEPGTGCAVVAAPAVVRKEVAEQRAERVLDGGGVGEPREREAHQFEWRAWATSSGRDLLLR